MSSRSHLPNLDGLRALAIVLVLLHHGPKLRGPLAVLQENGRYGVALFFALSGYLITTLLLRERARNGCVDLWRFYARRSVRLAPLYYGALGLYVFLVFVVGAYSPENRSLFAAKLPAYVFYYSNLISTATQGPFFFAWSLATEEQFYVVFGLAFRFLSARATTVLVAGTLGAKLFVVGWAGPTTPALTLLMSVQESILLGVIAALLASAWPEVAARIRPRPASVSVVVTLVVAALALIPFPDKHALRTQVLHVGMAALVYLAASSAPVAWLEARPLTFLGRASYALYLVHMLFLESAKKILPGAPEAALLIGSAGGIMAAAAVHLWVELPLGSVRARFSAVARAAPMPLGDPEVGGREDPPNPPARLQAGEGAPPAQ